MKKMLVISWTDKFSDYDVLDKGLKVGERSLLLVINREKEDVLEYSEA